MKKLRKKYSRPKRPWDADQIKTNKAILNKYGLHRQKEIWKAQQILRNFRERARLLTAQKDEKAEMALLDKVAKLGLVSKEVYTLDSVLSLSVEDILDRRLQTVLFKKGMATSISHARQLIAHGHVLIDQKKYAFPSYLVTVEDEPNIALSDPDLLKRLQPKESSMPVEPKEESVSEELQEAADSEEAKPDLKEGE